MRHASVHIIGLLCLLCSCSKGDSCNGNTSLKGQEMHDVIGWNVSASEHADASGPMTRALMEDYSSLRDACTQFEYREAEKIGLLGKLTRNGESETVFDDVDLWWWEKEFGNPFNDQLGNSSRWNYSGENVYWTEDAEYVFRAYFPKSLVTLQPGSGVDGILVVYDSQNSQYDLMVSHRKLSSRAENPVNLDMKHALSALKFDFRFVSDGITDNLLSCWLENNTGGRFYTSSTLNYSEDIMWPESSPNPAGTALYYWEPVAPVTITSQTPVSAYSTPAAVGKGSTYTDNSGWLLVIPQSSDVSGSLKLCFRTTTGGDSVYSVNLPGYDFQPGYRYTYHVKMTSTEIDLGLTIAQWNERKSSYEIDFND